jgi:hypothetical protein
MQKTNFYFIIKLEIAKMRRRKKLVSQTSRPGKKLKGSKQQEHQKWVKHLKWLGIKVEKPSSS